MNTMTALVRAVIEELIQPNGDLDYIQVKEHIAARINEVPKEKRPRKPWPSGRIAVVALSVRKKMGLPKRPQGYQPKPKMVESHCLKRTTPLVLDGRHRLQALETALPLFTAEEIRDVGNFLRSMGSRERATALIDVLVG